jgi:hypothetical protein
LNPAVINEDQFKKLEWFTSVVHAKKSKLVSGVKLSEQECEANKFRSDVWFSFIKECWESSGVLSKVNPNESIVDDVSVSLIVGGLTESIFSSVFHSVNVVNFEDRILSFMDTECKLLFILKYF